MKFSEFKQRVDESYKGGNLSKSPILFGDEDLKYLYQFPFKLWDAALAWRYGKGLWEASLERERSQSKIQGSSYNKTLGTVTNRRDVVLDLPGNKSYYFPNIDTGLPNLIRKLEKPINYNKLQQLSGRNINKKLRKYRSGMHDMDLSDPKFYSLDAERYQNLSSKERDKLEKSAPHTFASMKVMQLPVATKQIKNWVISSAIGILGDPDNPNKKVTGGKPISYGKVQDFYSDPQHGDKPIPVINTGPITYYEVERLPNGELREKRRIESPSNIVPVLAPGKLIPSLKKGKEEHPNAKKIVGSLTPDKHLIQHWDELTPEEKRHIRKNMGLAHFAKYDFQKGEENIPDASQTSRWILGGYEQAKDQRFKAPLTYWGFTKEEESKIKQEVFTAIDTEVQRITNDVIHNPNLSVGGRLLTPSQKAAVDRLAPRIAEVGRELVLQNLGYAPFGFINLNAMNNRSNKYKNFSSANKRASLDLNYIDQLKERGEEMAQALLAGKSARNVKVGVKGKSLSNIRNFIKNNWIGSVLQLKGLRTTSGSVTDEEGKTISALDNAVSSGPNSNLADISKRGRGEKAHYMTNPETLFMSHWISNIRAAADALEDKSSTDELIRSIEKQKSTLEGSYESDKDSVSIQFANGLDDLLAGKHSFDIDRGDEDVITITTDTIKNNANNWNANFNSIIKQALDSGIPSEQKSGKRLQTKWNMLIDKLNLNLPKLNYQFQMQDTPTEPNFKDKTPDYKIYTQYQLKSPIDRDQSRQETIPRNPVTPSFTTPINKSPILDKLLARSASARILKLRGKQPPPISQEELNQYHQAIKSLPLNDQLHYKKHLAVLMR